MAWLCDQGLGSRVSFTCTYLRAWDTFLVSTDYKIKPTRQSLGQVGTK